MLNRIVIAGGSGFLGKALIEYFKDKAFRIVVLSRREFPSYAHVNVVEWDGATEGRWARYLENADAVINLAGKNVNCRYTKKNREEILQSRLRSTRVIGDAIAKCKTPPKLWVNAASATIYRASYDKMMTELRGETGDDFSVGVCKKWEELFNSYKLADTRKVIFRTGIVLGNDGGALVPLKSLVRAGFGGHQGDGRQFCSWLHVRDFSRAIEWAIRHEKANGVYNLCSPAPIPNRNFMRALRNAMDCRAGLPIPRLLLEAGAAIIGTETELVLKSRKVFPEKLLEEGFVFEFDEANVALEDLCRKKATIRPNSTSSH